MTLFFSFVIVTMMSVLKVTSGLGQMITEDIGVRHSPPKFVDVSNLHSENVRRA
jgi:hypothetical protein